MTLKALQTSRLSAFIVIAVLFATFFGILAPTLAFGQTGTAPSCPAGSTAYKVASPDGVDIGYVCRDNQSGQTVKDTTPGSIPTSCQSWYSFWVNFPTCGGRALAVWSGGLLVAISGWILGVAGVLFNAALEFTTIGFDSQIYARISGGIEATWTAFRDIANIIIIGMFTFVALTMILGIEKFNARQMVAKVLLIAVLINFSLLFTRVIIASSNFVATQFYKAAKFDSEGAQMAIQGAQVNNVSTQFTAGISGKFAQLLGVAGVFDTKDALWKASESADSGWVALLMGLLSAAIFLAVSFVFLYASFLLIARAILFIFLLLTSSLAFASYLIPGGGFAGYGWDSWWRALLKNAVFAPLLLLLIWATIQVGSQIKMTNGTIGGLLADPGKGGNINALFSYLLILGMLYVSIKIASKFAHEIGGFNYAAIAPAFGAGLLARAGGFLGRQVVGRTGLAASNYLGARAKTAAENENFFAARLYQSGAKQFEGVAKRDFNLMRGQLGKEIQGVAGIKKLDSLAGKNLEGFKGIQDKFVKNMAEQGKKLERTKEEKEQMRQEAIKAQLQADPHASSSRDHAEKTEEKGRYEAIHNEITKENAATRDRFENEMRTLGRQLQQAQSSGGAGSTAARNIESQIAEARRKHESDLTEQTERIKAAKSAINRADTELKAIESSVERAAVASGRLPDFKSGSELGADLVKASYTKLFRATIPNKAGVDELAKKVHKEVDKLKKKEKRKEDVDAFKEIFKEEGGGEHKAEEPKAGDAGTAPH